MSSAAEHQPVLLEEAVTALQIKEGGVYIDGTFGRGGHSARILEQLDLSGRLYAFDQDADAIRFGEVRFESDKRIHLLHTSFENIEAVAEEAGLLGAIDGIFLDLGVSSPQLDEAHRGFSFAQDGPLDMRMDTSRGVSAAKWLQGVTLEELRSVLKKYGEEKLAHPIAKKIIARRDTAPFERTLDLASLVASCYPPGNHRLHPATRTFQAIRIQINNELGALEKALNASLSLLKKGGRLVVISFHSLEDRMVKRFMRNPHQVVQSRHALPPMENALPEFKLVDGLQVPGDEELQSNPRARSARMRVAEMLS